MKKLKLTMLLCLIFVLAITAVACGSAETTTTQGTTEATVTDTTPAVTTTVPVTTEPTPVEKFASLKIGETPLSEYTVVYAQSMYAAQAKTASLRMFFPVYDFNRETAERLSDLIFDVSGIRLKVVEDKASTETANEILVGKTNRDVSALSLDALKSDDYLIDVEGTKLVICGGEYGTTWHAIDYLDVFFSEQLEEGKADYAFAADYNYKGEHHLVRIGCIGDSITQGVGATDQALLSYPAQLGRYLWKDAIVTNFGSSGATMRSDLNDAYTKRAVFSSAVKAAAETDIFTIMLGTNDSNRDQDWSDKDSNQYNMSCMNIMRTLTMKNKNLKFVLANCPAYFGDRAFGSETIRDLQDKLLIMLNDKGYPTTFFDMYSVTKTMSVYYPDQLHPNNIGHMRMAEAFVEGLMALINPMESEAK